MMQGGGLVFEGVCGMVIGAVLFWFAGFWLFGFTCAFGCL